jgi:hypothetical protein
VKFNNTYQGLDVEEEDADEVVAGLVHPPEVDEGVDGGSERAVEPSAALANELGGRLGDISLSLAVLDVGKGPLLALLGHELEAEDTVLSQEHVLLEDGHAVDALVTETGGQGVVAVEVLLEGAALDSTVAVGAEGTGEDRDVAEGALEGLVEDVGHLVLEVLSSNEGVQEALATHGVDLAGATTEVVVVVERLPEVVDGLVAGLGASIDEDANFGLDANLATAARKNTNTLTLNWRPMALKSHR